MNKDTNISEILGIPLKGKILAKDLISLLSKKATINLPLSNEKDTDYKLTFNYTKGTVTKSYKVKGISINGILSYEINRVEE